MTGAEGSGDRRLDRLLEDIEDTAQGTGQRVLLSLRDPDEESRVRDQLDPLGFDTVSVREPSRTLDAARGGDFHLLVCDQEPWEGGGRWLVERLRGEGLELPVLLVGPGRDEAVRQAREAGAAGFLGRPLDDPREVVRRVSRAVQGGAKAADNFPVPSSQATGASQDRTSIAAPDLRLVDEALSAAERADRAASPGSAQGGAGGAAAGEEGAGAAVSEEEAARREGPWLRLVFLARRRLRETRPPERRVRVLLDLVRESLGAEAVAVVEARTEGPRFLLDSDTPRAPGDGAPAARASAARLLAGWMGAAVDRPVLRLGFDTGDGVRRWLVALADPPPRETPLAEELLDECRRLLATAVQAAAGGAGHVTAPSDDLLRRGPDGPGTAAAQDR